MNWDAEGFQDGQAGKMPRDLTDAIKDCSEFKLGVDTGRYTQGYRNGVKVFCSPSRETGLIDGQSGKFVNDINSRVPVCNASGINLDVSSYLKGHQEGLKQFCTYENGANIARSGQALPEVCPTNLRENFSRGWQAGQQAYCQETVNAFAMGKAGQPYPSVCPQNLYVGFKSEYDRGYTIGQQIKAGEYRINDINNYISYRRSKYDFDQSADGFFRLGKNQTPEAAKALDDVNNLVRERRHIERDMFNLKVMR